MLVDTYNLTYFIDILTFSKSQNIPFSDCQSVEDEIGDHALF